MWIGVKNRAKTVVTIHDFRFPYFMTKYFTSDFSSFFIQLLNRGAMFFRFRTDIDRLYLKCLFFLR